MALFAVFATASCLQAATVKNVKSGDYPVNDPAVWKQTTMSASDDYQARALSGTDPSTGQSWSGWIEMGRDGKDMTFPGNSLRLYLRTMFYGTKPERTYTFPRGGLIMDSGSILRHRQTINGAPVIHFAGTKLTVQSGVTANFLTVQNAPNSTVFSIDMPIYGSSTSIINLFAESQTGAVRFRPTKDMSNFKGKITISGNVSNRVVALSSPTLTIPVTGSGVGGIEQGDPAAVCDSAVTLTGAGKGCVFMTTNGTFTVKNLSMAGGAFVWLPYGAGAKMRNPGVLVFPSTATFATSEPIALRVNRQALMFSGQTLGGLDNVVPLVRYEGTLAFPLHNFYLDVDNNVEPGMGSLPGDFTLGMMDVDGAKVVYVQVPAQTIFKVNTDADNAASTGDGHRGSALSDGMGQYKWSDGADQHPNANYVVGNYNGTNMAIIVSDDASSSVFRGTSLAIGESCRFSLLGKSDGVNTFEAENLSFAGNAQVLAYNNVGSSWRFLGGPVRFIKNYNNSFVNITPVTSVNMTFTEGICGDARIRFYNSTTNWKSALVAKVTIAKPSLDFSGCIEVQPASTAKDQRPGRPQTLTTLEAPYASCFGGPMPSFNYDALVVNGNQTVSLTETTTFEEPTRGISFKTLDQGVPAYFNVADGKRVTILQQLSFYGEVQKTGGGILAVGGTNAVRFVNGPDGGFTPQENTNKLTIVAGTLMPLATNALDGCEITFMAGTRLALKADTEDAALRRYGLYNTKWEKPIVLEDTEYINIDFEAASGYQLPANNERVALCTVPMDYNGLTVESFRLGPLGERRGSVIVETDMTAGTRTFYADFSEAGMAIVVR